MGRLAWEKTQQYLQQYYVHFVRCAEPESTAFGIGTGGMGSLPDLSQNSLKGMSGMEWCLWTFNSQNEEHL